MNTLASGKIKKRIVLVLTFPRKYICICFSTTQKTITIQEMRA